MVLDLLLWLLYSSLVVSESSKLPISANKLEFDLWPYKKIQVDSSADEMHYMTCVDMSTLIKARDLQFRFEVKEFTKWKVNVDRFGPTSSSKGKQVVNVDIWDEQNNLVRSRHGLENGESVLHLSVYGQQKFRICLINLSLDSSWNAIDTVKQVSLSINSNDLIRKKKWNLLTDNDMVLLDETKETLFALVNTKTGQELKLLDIEHRNFNEASYNWLMWKSVLILVTMTALQLLIVPFLLYRFMQNHQKLKSKAKFMK